VGSPGLHLCVSLGHLHSAVLVDSLASLQMPATEPSMPRLLAKSPSAVLTPSAVLPPATVPLPMAVADDHLLVVSNANGKRFACLDDP
jgi:hypothetical protein